IFLLLSLSCKHCTTNKKSVTNIIQLTPEFGGQSGEICFVLRTPLMNAALNRIFPINIDPVKNARTVYSGGEVAGNERLHAGANEIAQMIRRGRAGKTLRLSPAPE